MINYGTVQQITNFSVPRATDELKQGASTTLADKNKTSSASNKNLPNVVDNPMEQFASYSALWTLACLTPEQFNNPSSYRSSPQALSNLVFSSAGRYDDQRVKTFFGTPEYYINNFQMNCVIAATQQTGNSNAIKFSFDIIEPHSMGLLLQSIQNAAVKAGYISYLGDVPYVLRMDIVGYDELGVVIKSIKPKFFTLKLTSVKFTVNEGGSVYKVEAVPFNHLGFADTINVAYNDIKISGDVNGKGTVSEVLATSKNSLVAVLNRNEELLVKEKRIAVPDVYDIQFPQISNEWYSSAGRPPSTPRATANPSESPFRSVSGGATRAPDAENMPMNELGDASLGFDQLRGGNALFKRAQDQIDSKSGIVKRDGMTIDTKVRAFQFGQKQSITAIINQVILSSDYAKQAILDKEEGGFGLTPQGYIKWFKIDVQIELLQYDPLIGDYAKKFTFRVVPYYVHNSIFSNPSAAPLGYNELMKTVVKEYQYIYTGQNVDILKFDININNLFYTGQNPKPESESAKSSNQDQKFSEVKIQSTKTNQGAAPAAQAAQLGRQRIKRDPRLLRGYKGGNPDKTVEQNIAENFQQTFISGNSADLVKVDLEIMGDPYWLVDSGIANYFAPISSPVSQITSDGTMNYESGNVYVYLTFRTPADINEKTGLYDFSVSGKESAFGGIYRVTMCENTFSDGHWKQKLTCLRMPGPQGPEANDQAQGNTPLQTSQSDNLAVGVDAPAAPKQSPIDTSNNEKSLVDANASPTTTANKPQSTSSAKKAKTVTSSNVGERRVGFRYYRDLGQN